MEWLQEHIPMFTSMLTITGTMTFILYLALTNRLDERYMKEKECEQKEKVRDVMIKAIRDDISDLKETNKTIFTKLDVLNGHIMELIGRNR